MTLELKQVQALQNARPLFSPVSLKLEAGKLATIMGPSGCGKSTLLTAICGNLSPVFTLKGDIVLNGKSIISIPMKKRKVGILFQDDLLFPHMDVAENLAFALPPGTPKPLGRQKISAALQSAGLSGFEKRDPATLSGGQRARISLFRSLIAEPEAILLDEPFSKLDLQLREQIRRFVFHTIRKMHIPALLVTHDPRDCPEGQGLRLTLDK